MALHTIANKCTCCSLLLMLILMLKLANSNETCKTPNGKDGICMQLKHCKNLVKQLRKLGENVTETFRNDVKSRHCATSKERLYICCELEDMTLPTNSPNETTTTTVTESLLPITAANPSIDYDHAQELDPQGLSMLRAMKCGKYTQVIGYCAYCTTTNYGEFPWMALLQYDSPKKYNCGGTLISNRYVLTAAHCLVGQRYNLTGVRLGEHNLNTTNDCDSFADQPPCPPAEDFGIEKIIPHPLYKGIKNDIALIRLDRDVEFKNHIEPVCLPTTEDTKKIVENTLFEILGWGTTEHGTTSPILLKGYVPLQNVGYCQQIYQDSDISEQHICAGGDKKVDSCKGDSGGPIVNRKSVKSGASYFQFGIISFGASACGSEKSFPTLYTKIESYLPWITKIIAASQQNMELKSEDKM